jgi:cyclic beta-1,2-glucan synthetase
MEAEARAVLRAILPNTRPADGFGGRFLNEPYALSADVGMAPGLEGRGGWSLYTGAAGWLWRALSDESEGKTP